MYRAFGHSIYYQKMSIPLSSNRFTRNSARQPDELIVSGAQFGTFLCLPSSSTIAYYFGWEYIFYTFGGIGTLWLTLWTFLVFESPSVHPRISKVTSWKTTFCFFRLIVLLCVLQAEQKFIESNMLPAKKLPGQTFPPLRQLLTSVPFLALLVAQTGFSWGSYTLMSGTPLFLNNMHHFSLTDVSGILQHQYKALIEMRPELSERPSLHPSLHGNVLCVVPGGHRLRLPCQQRLRVNCRSEKDLQLNRLSRCGRGDDLAQLCRVWQHDGRGGVGCCKHNQCGVLCRIQRKSNVAIKREVFTIILSLQMNHADLSPHSSGFLMAIANTIASMTGFLAPLLTGFITENNVL